MSFRTPVLAAALVLIGMCTDNLSAAEQPKASAPTVNETYVVASEDGFTSLRREKADGVGPEFITFAGGTFNPGAKITVSFTVLEAGTPAKPGDKKVVHGGPACTCDICKESHAADKAFVDELFAAIGTGLKTPADLKKLAPLMKKEFPKEEKAIDDLMGKLGNAPGPMDPAKAKAALLEFMKNL